MSFVMLRPSRRSVVEAEAVLAPRLESLEGKVVGTLWNNRANGDAYFRLLGEELRSRFGVRELVTRKKIYNNSMASTEILDDLRDSCDAVVVGIGD